MEQRRGLNSDFSAKALCESAPAAIFMQNILKMVQKRNPEKRREREREQSEKTMTAALSSIVCFFNIANKRGERAECKIASMQNATQLAKTFGGYAATSKYNMKIFIYIKSVAEIRIENFLR